MTARPEPLPRSKILRFWLPLAATWLMMGLEGPYIAAIVARMPAAELSLAAFGVATSLAWLIESPIMMLFSAATALVHGRDSYCALRRFTNVLNGAVTIAMAVMVIPPVFRFIGDRLIGLPAEISESAHSATTMLILWPAAIGYRRFYQGILVRHHLTRRVAYGTVVRLVCMSITAAALAVHGSVSGARLGTSALIAGVVGEALASRWMARRIVRELMESEEPPVGSLLTLTEIARFYYPLGLTSILSMALGPLVTFGLGHGRAPVASLAIWPVLISFAFLFRSGGIAFQEAGIALMGKRGEHDREVRRTAEVAGILASLALSAVVWTPLAGIWFERVSGLTHALAQFTIWPARILFLLPFTEYVLSIQRARLILGRQTYPITVATAVECAGLAATLLVAIGGFHLAGAVGGAIAMIVGRLAANAFLAVRRTT